MPDNVSPELWGPFNKAINAIMQRDWDTFQNSFAEDGVYVSYGLGVMNGSQEIRQGIGGMVETELKNGSLSMDIHEVNSFGSVLVVDRIEIVTYNDGATYPIRNPVTCIIEDGKILTWSERTDPSDYSKYIQAVAARENA